MDYIPNIKNYRLSKYRLFIFDIAGTIYGDFINLLEVKKIIKYLISENKKIVLLSNSSSSSNDLKKRLINNKLSCIQNVDLYSSGQYFIHLFKLKKIPGFIHNTPRLSYIGVKKNPKIFRLLNCLQYKIEDSNLAIITECFNKELYESFFEKNIYKLLKFKLDLICINPDILLPNTDQTFAPGYFAKEYKKNGGRVFYIGKPNINIFQWVYESTKSKIKFKKSEILMIGDNVNTDIQGAKQFGIDSLLVMSGVNNSKKIIKKVPPTYFTEKLIL